MIDKSTDGYTPFLFTQTMSKINFIIAICLCCMFTSCSITRNNTYSVSYQAIRQKYAQPTPENPIPDEAKIAVAYTISSNGELTAIVYNRTSEIMTIDQTLSFFVNSDGKSTSYYDPTVRTTSTTDLSSSTKGASVNLGSIASAFGIGGTIGQLANGINIGGSGTTGQSITEATYIADLPQVSLAPNSNAAMSKVFTVWAIVDKTDSEIETIKPIISHSESPCRFSVCISYSIDGGKTFEKIVTEFYMESYINIPLRSEGNVSETLNIIEQNKADMYNVPWFMLWFKDKRDSDNTDRFSTGIIYDYQ